MISYFIDGIILLAVAATGYWVFRTQRELKALRDYHGEYQRIFAETGDAVATVDMALREIHANGAQIVLALGDRIDEANKLVLDIDDRMDAAVQHFEAQREAQSNVVQFTAPRQPEPQPQPETYRAARASAADYYRELRQPEPAPQPQPQQRPVQWPSLGDRFSQWRQSEMRPDPKIARR